MRTWLLGLIGATVVGVAACASTEDGGDDASDEAQIVSVTRPDDAPEVLVRDPATLMPLESRFSLSAMLGATGASGAELKASSAAYRAIVDTVTAEVKAVAASDKSAGKGFEFTHRLFDERWLGSADVRFELTGIANRIDLAHRGGCGEVHFVYRMAYTTDGPSSTRIDSRVPFTINVLVPIPDDGAQCSTVARKWLTVHESPGAELVAGPLAGLGKPAQVEINYQLQRWPSKAREDMGGHAEYAMHGFALVAEGLRPIPLADTPRTDLGDKERAALRSWIGENLQKIDDGTAIVPEQFLATAVRSVAPRSSVRLGNRPFTALFKEAELADLPLATTGTVTSPKALLHKLDGMTCEGCHQMRGIAGFHLLGEERVGTLRLNALAVGASAHLLDAVSWRKSFLNAVAGGQTRPKRLAPDHASGTPGGFGAHCSLGRDPGFKGWSCIDGLQCKRVDDDELGHCLPPGEPSLGDACEDSTVSQSLDPRVDRVDSRVLTCAGGATCQRSGSGFPDGVCQRRCERLGDRTGDQVCAGVPFGTGALGGFNNCLFTLKRPFTECLADDVRPTASRACDDTHPCRDDYVCARIFIKGAIASTVEPQGGACMPPYFVFQGRVDGHVLKR
jgi:hypothetical protein